jgi:glycine/D-amino acid oxidase-like deaminating enzyme
MNLKTSQKRPDVRPDVIVVGAGITGSALSYELAIQGMQVLLLDRTLHNAPNATRYSYGGISYWAGTTESTRILCEEGIIIHRQLSQILGSSTEFRELPLLSTIGLDQDPDPIVQSFQPLSIAPQRLTPREAQTIEPLLNPNAIAAALLMPYAQIHPEKTAFAYQQAFLRLGGWLHRDRIGQIQACESGVKLLGEREQYFAPQVIICAGGEARSLLHHSGYRLCQYFSHAESMEVEARELQKRSIQMQAVVMPAEIRRVQLESQAVKQDPEWAEGVEPIVPAILDSGALQFADGSLRFGQISRTYPSLAQTSDPKLSEQWIRQEVGKILPDLATLPGTWVTCTVAFSSDHLPIIGALTPDDRVQIFSGFSNPMALFPATARRFAHQIVKKQADPILKFCSPDRFLQDH